MKPTHFAYLALLLILSSGFVTGCQTRPLNSPLAPILAQKATGEKSRTQSEGTQYAISTQGEASSRAADQMFQAGGNIIDALVAASFAISVERPHSTGISGGGFLLFREAKSQKTYAIDFRERAPLKSTKNMYLGPDGKAIPEKSITGALAVAVPGLVAGLYEIHQKFGKLPWAQTLQPAIALAENGFSIYPSLHDAMKVEAKNLKKDPAAKKLFLNAQGEPLPLGANLIQKDLAASLRLIAKNGKDGFYKGPTSDRILAWISQRKGILERPDFETYQVLWRTPVEGQFKDHQIYSMPPPSSGGVHVLQFLSFLEEDQLAKEAPHSLRAIHLQASALQSAFTDRAQYLGDPDFWKVPVKGLTDKSYLKMRRAQVDPKKARSAEQVKAGDPTSFQESTETTHISIMDKDGNAVASTQTINGYFGAGVVVPGTGIVLNNEMDDFTAQVGAQNLFGAVGGLANSIQPRKTPLSSMSPTLVLKNNQPIMSVGAPGGTRIISCVAQTLLNHLEYQMPLFEAVSAIRVHHQWRPDVLTIDPPGPDFGVRLGLEQMGYKVELKPVPCYTMAVSKQGDRFTAVSDPRDAGQALAR